MNYLHRVYGEYIYFYSTYKELKLSLFTTDEFINDLFPDGALTWKETRDILLFRIYEKLSDYIKEKKEIIEEIEENEEV